LFIDLLSSRVNDRLKLSEHYRIGRLFWPIVSTIGLSDIHIIVLTLVLIHLLCPFFIRVKSTECILETYCMICCASVFKLENVTAVVIHHNWFVICCLAKFCCSASNECVTLCKNSTCFRVETFYPMTAQNEVF